MNEPSADPLTGLTSEHFAPWVGTAFRTDHNGGEALTLELVAVVVPPVDEFHLAARKSGGIRLQPFNLHFRGPRSPRLSQGIRHLEHVGLGMLDLFLVPIGLDPAGLLYEAVFN